MSWTAAARGASGVLRQRAISASIWPSRRSAVATSRRAKARSRPDNWCIDTFSSIASSSGRLRRSTAPIRSSAALRAVGTWDIKVLLGHEWASVVCVGVKLGRCDKRLSWDMVPVGCNRYGVAGKGLRSFASLPHFDHGRAIASHRRATRARLFCRRTPCGAAAQRNRRPEGARANPLWRLGVQRSLHRFLSCLAVRSRLAHGGTTSGMRKRL